MRRFWSLHDRGQIRRVFKETKIEVLPARCGRRRREIRVSEQDQAEGQERTPSRARQLAAFSSSPTNSPRH